MAYGESYLRGLQAAQATQSPLLGQIQAGIGQAAGQALGGELQDQIGELFHGEQRKTEEANKYISLGFLPEATAKKYIKDTYGKAVEEYDVPIIMGPRSKQKFVPIKMIEEMEAGREASRKRTFMQQPMPGEEPVVDRIPMAPRIPTREQVMTDLPVRKFREDVRHQTAQDIAAGTRAEAMKIRAGQVKPPKPPFTAMQDKTMVDQKRQAFASLNAPQAVMRTLGIKTLDDAKRYLAAEFKQDPNDPEFAPVLARFKKAKGTLWGENDMIDPPVALPATFTGAPKGLAVPHAWENPTANDLWSEDIE
jgi:hypothetical protein